MDEKIQALPKRRRTRAECEQLVADFEASGLNRTEFCRQHGLSLTTLARYGKRRQIQPNVPAAAGWLAVELCNARPAVEAAMRPSGLAVALRGGRRIEVERGFDAHTLMQLVSVLERR